MVVVMKKVKPTMLSVADAAVLLGVTDRQVRNLIKSGALPATKIGHVHVIQRADAEALPRRRPGPKPRRA